MAGLKSTMQVSPPEPRHKKNLVAKTATDEYTNVAWMKKIRLEEQVIDTNSHEYKEETSPSQEIEACTFAADCVIIVH